MFWTSGIEPWADGIFHHIPTAPTNICHNRCGLVFVVDLWPNAEFVFNFQALKGLERGNVEVATKFGIKSLEGEGEVCGDPEYVRACCEASLKRLDVDYIDLYYVQRVDARVPIEITVSNSKSPFLLICIIYRNLIQIVGIHLLLERCDTVKNNSFVVSNNKHHSLYCLFIYYLSCS